MFEFSFLVLGLKYISSELPKHACFLFVEESRCCSSCETVSRHGKEVHCRERKRRVVVIGSVLIDAYPLKDLLLLLPATVQHCIYICLLVSIKAIPSTCVHAVFMYVCCVGHTDQENGRDAAMPADDR